jgi:hypothetical protein
MQALDNIISPITSFEVDTLILMVPISAQTPSIELADDSSAGPSARSPKTRAGKHKDFTTPRPPKKL